MSDGTNENLNRGGFLKASGTAAAVTFLGDKLLQGSISKTFKELNKEAKNEEWVYSWCRQCALPPCGIKVKVRDGVAVKVEGDPKCPTNKGKLCSRGNATIQAVYNPYRVKSPLKRTNPQKGLDVDPRWVEISWDEAYSTIVEELDRVRKDDPKKFIWNNGFARAGSMFEGMEFCHAYGTPNYIEVDGPNCSVHFGSSIILGNFVGPNYDPDYTNYLIVMGCTSIAGQGYATQGQSFGNAIARGMKVVTVDPRATMSSSKGEWVPIRPGTDYAFVLAMQHVILHELNRFDVEFIKNETNAPYLIGPDQHYVRDQESGKPLMWDAEAGEAKTFDDPSIADVALGGKFEVNGVEAVPAFQLYKEAMAKYTPEWAEEKTSVPASTIRKITAEFVEEAQIGSTITLQGTELRYRPVALHPARGSITQYYGANFHCSAIMVNMLVGALDTPGGGQGGMGPPHKSVPAFMALSPDQDGTVAPKVEAKRREFIYPPTHIDGKTFMPYSHDNPHIVYDAILDPEKYDLPYEPEVIFVWGGNAMLRMYEPKYVEQAMKKMKFIFALSYSVDEPTLMADIVLPESAGLERYAGGGRAALVDTPQGKRNAIISLIAQQVIDPVYDTKQPDEVFAEIGDRLGILRGKGGMYDLVNTGRWAPPRLSEPYLWPIDKKITPKEMADHILKSGTEGEVDMDSIRNEASFLIKAMPPQKAIYAQAVPPENKGRYSLYLDHLLKMGEDLRADLEEVGAEFPGWPMDKLMEHYRPIPEWIDPLKETPEEFNLYAVNWKTPQFSFGVGGTAENPWLHEASQWDPYLHKVCINTQTGRDLGLQDGDQIWVESQYGGKVKGEVKLSQAFHPEIVGIAGMFGHLSKQMAPQALKGLHFNSLMSNSPEDIDPVSAGFDGAPNVKVYKA